MPVKIVCTGCRKTLKLPDKYAGKRVKCPACGAALYVPEAAAAEDDLSIQPLESAAPGPSAGPGAPGGPAAASFCPQCGKPVAPGGVICMHCGTNVVTGEAVPAAGYQKPRGPRIPVKLIVQLAILLVAVGVGYYVYKRAFGGKDKDGGGGDPSGETVAPKRPEGGGDSAAAGKRPAKGPDGADKGPEETAEAEKPKPKPINKGPTVRERFDAAMAKVTDPLEKPAGIREISHLGVDALPLIRENLKSDDPSIRAAMARCLGSCPITDVKDDLALLVVDEEPSVRSSAAYALRRYGTGSIDACLELAQSDNPRAREAAISALGVNAKSPAAVAAVTGAATDSDAAVRYAAISALSTTMSDKTAVPLLMNALADDDIDIADTASRALTKHRRAVIPAMRKLFDPKDPKSAFLCWRVLRYSSAADMREEIAKKVLAVRGRNTPKGNDLGRKLITVLTMAGGRATLAKVMALDKMDPGVVPFLVLQLATGHKSAGAARALRGVRDTYIHYPLVICLAEDNAELVDEAMGILAHQAKNESLMVLLRKASHGRQLQRKIFASGLLAKHGEGEAADELLKALRNTDLPGGIRGIAAKILADLGDKRALEALEVYLQQEKLAPMERLGYLVAAARLGREGGYTEVIGILTSGKDMATRRAAALALASVDDDLVKQALVSCFVNPHENMDLRIECMNSIVRAGGKHAVPVLAEQLGKLSGKLTNAVTNALVNIGQDAEEPVLRVLKEGDAKAQNQAAQILSAFGSRRCLNALLEILQSERSTAMMKKSAENSLSAATGQRFLGNTMMWDHYINPDRPLKLSSVHLISGGRGSGGGTQKCAKMSVPEIWSGGGGRTQNQWTATKWPGKPVAILRSSYSSERKFKGRTAPLLEQVWNAYVWDGQTGKPRSHIKVKTRSMSKALGNGGRFTGFIFEDTKTRPPKTKLIAVGVVRGKTVEAQIRLDIICPTSEWKYYWPLFRKMFQSVKFIDPVGGTR